MIPMTVIRVRSKLAPEQMVGPDGHSGKVGKIVGRADIDLMMIGPTEVRLPDGSLLCKYLPKALDVDLLEASYEILHGMKSQLTDNRGLASGGVRRPQYDGSLNTRAPTVASAIAGAIEATGRYHYCRLTAWSGAELEGEYPQLFPLFQRIGDYFKEYVPERHGVQMSYIRKTHPDWVIKGTPFTTVTVNNSYPTGVHKDAGDLEQGFSTLAVLRRGEYSGGVFTFPEYRLGVDMQHGDLLLMDAHQWHGNTFMRCNVCGEGIGSRDYYPKKHDEECGTERISIVCYFRTKMTTCGSSEEEAQKAMAFADKRADARADDTMSNFGRSLVEEMATETV